MSEILFYMPQNVEKDNAFGAATLGFAGMPHCPADTVCSFSLQPKGMVLNGTYEEIIAAIPKSDYTAAIVLCGNAGGENDFVKQLSPVLNCPIVGGGAAMNGDIGGLIVGGGQASVLLVKDERYNVNVQTLNIHRHIVGEVCVDFDEENPRIVKAIEGQEPKQWLDKQKETFGFLADDFEHFTLSDTQNINAHLSFDGQCVRSGRDLQHHMIARYVKPEEVVDAVFDFYNDDANTLVFGCAGIKGITGEIPKIKSLGLYMYGEICFTQNGAEFGNLMLSKIRFEKR